jgi:allophanate hydrolase subunit 1
MFDAERDTPMLFDVGDEIKFEQIDKEEFLRLGGQLS